MMRLIILIFICVIFLYKTILQNFSNIPKSHISDEVYRKLELTLYRKNIHMNGKIFELKLCETCYIWKPFRTSHCSLCDHCILLFDHHCPWIKICIGLGNYRFFILFTNSFLWCILHCIYLCSKKTFRNKIINSKKMGVNKTLLLFFMIIFVFVIFKAVFVFLLICFHFYLNFQGLTASELFKFTIKPFWIKNFRNNLFVRFKIVEKPDLLRKNYHKKTYIIKPNKKIFNLF
nr:putative protein S-acyltransferase 1 [Cryptomonas paramecium]